MVPFFPVVSFSRVRNPPNQTRDERSGTNFWDLATSLLLSKTLSAAVLLLRPVTSGDWGQPPTVDVQNPEAGWSSWFPPRNEWHGWSVRRGASIWIHGGLLASAS